MPALFRRERGQGIDDRVEPEAGRGVAGQTSDQLFETARRPRGRAPLRRDRRARLVSLLPHVDHRRLGRGDRGKAILLPDHLAEKVYGELRIPWRLQCNHPTVRICSGGFDTGVGSTTGTSCGVGISGASGGGGASPGRGTGRGGSVSGGGMFGSVGPGFGTSGPVGGDGGKSGGGCGMPGGCAVRSLVPSQRESAWVRPVTIEVS